MYHTNCYHMVLLGKQTASLLVCSSFRQSRHCASSKIHTCQPQTLSNVIQSEKGNQRDGLWLACMDLATHFGRSNTVGFWFSSRASSGPFGWIFDWKVREELWIFWPLCCEVWKRSDAILGGKIAPALELFQNKDSSLVLLIYGTVNGELKFLQDRSKNRFWGKRTTINHR